MGTDTDTKSSDSSEIKPLEELTADAEPSKEPEKRDIIEPLEETGDEPVDQQQENESDTPEEVVDDAQEIPADENDGKADSDVKTNETEMHRDKNDEGINEASASDDPSGPESEEEAISLETPPGEPDSKDEAAAENPETDSDPVGDAESPKNEEPFSESTPNEKAENNDETEFIALDEDEADDATKIEAKDGGEDEQLEDNKKEQTVKEAAHDKDPGESKIIDDNKQPPPKNKVKGQKGKKSLNDAASSKKIIVSTLIIFAVACAILYSKSAFLDRKNQPENNLPAKTAIKKPAETTQIQVREPAPRKKDGVFLSKLEEVNRLREELLEKKEEIYRLKLHYRNGIAELMDQIGLEIKEGNISSFSEAFQHKRIELNLRTIQRRHVYIQELEKPDQWLQNGSEELLFLKRKALLDFQMKNIASGIDLKRHMRYMNAAIQKYQPSAEKLGVDPPPAQLMPLEDIWDQIIHQQAENQQVLIGQEDEEIIAEICSGNFNRMADLTAINSKAAKCLARMNGSDLFLNRLTQLTPEDAKYLFEWQGNWICLNSVKKLSPAVAKYLFKWGGNWISLNGLTEFSPELALYLMEWKGDQLELMGLTSQDSKPAQRTLKYLALWETMGGKLFVSDDIRNEMKRVM